MIRAFIRRLRVRHIDYLLAHSRHELGRVCDDITLVRDDRLALIRNEAMYQDRLIARRDAIARGE